MLFEKEKKKRKKSKKGDLIAPFIFDKQYPTPSGFNTQILYHQIHWDDQVFCGESKLIGSGVIE